MNLKWAVLFLVAALAVSGCISPFSTEQAPPAQNQNEAPVLPAGLITQDVRYFGDAKGYLARPNDDTAYPGVVLIHEWWGLNEFMKKTAENLATEGFSVLAVDLYRDQVAVTPEQARELVGSVQSEDAIANLQAAVRYLRYEQNAPKIGSFGYCFGGGQSMQLSLSGESLNATVIYYGQLVTEETQLQNIHWPVLGIFGEADQSIPVEKVNEFENALNQSGISSQIHIYPGLGHAFANPSNPSHAPAETADAWNKTVSFLNQSLKQ